MNYAIKTQGLHKTFSIGRKRITMFGLIRKTLNRKSLHRKTVYALRHVEFEIMRGEKVGIIGNNGSGKSTLLRIIAGLHQPDQGQVNVNGSLVLPAGLGIGMKDELSVEEKVYL